MSKLAKVFVQPSIVQRRCFATAPQQSAGGKTIGQLLNEKTAEYEHKDVFRHVEKNHRWTYVELKKNVDALGNGFLDAGFKKGKKLALSFQSEAEGMVSFLAAAKSGAVPAFYGEHIPANNIQSFLEKVAPHAFFFNPKATNVWDVYKLFPELQRSLVNTERLPNFPYLKYVVKTDPFHLNGMLIFRDLVQHDRRPDVINQTTANAQDIVTAVVEQDKLQGLNHGAALGLAQQLGQQLQLDTSDRVCVVISLSSIAGQTAGVLAPVSFGSMIVVPTNVFNAEEAVKAIQNEHCTALIATPEQLSAIASLIKSKNIKTSLKKALIVGPTSAGEQAKRELNLSHVTTFNPQDATKSFSNLQ